MITGNACWEQVKANVAGMESSPPGQRSLHVAVVYQQSMYIFGGYDGNGRVNEFHRFDFVNMTWQSMIDVDGTPPTARDRHSGVVLGDELLIFGGFDGLCRVNDLHTFSFETMRWTTVQRHPAEQRPTPRHSHSAVSYNGSMYVFGGYDGAYKNDLYRYEPGQGDVEPSWERVATVGRLPQARYRASCVTFEKRMILFGGHDGQRHLNCTHIFDFETSTWSAARVHGPVPLPRDSHVALVFGGAMFMFGGSSGNAMNDFHLLSLRGEYAWTPVSRNGWSPCSRFCHVAVEYDNSMYIYGGYDGATRLSDFHRFKFAPSVCRVARSTLVDDLAKYVGNELQSDLVFVVGGLPIFAHRVFVSRCSSLMDLENMGACSRSPTGLVTLEICDTRYETFKAFLNYLYTDRVSFAGADLLAVEIYVLADKFNVERLKRICLNFVAATLTVYNAALLFEATHRHGISTLRSRTLSFILQNFDEVSKTSAFEEMGKRNVELVFEILRQRGAEDRSTDVVPEVSSGAPGSGTLLCDDNQYRLKQWLPVMVNGAEDGDKALSPGDDVGLRAGADFDYLSQSNPLPPPQPQLQKSGPSSASRPSLFPASMVPEPPARRPRLDSQVVSVSKRSLHVVAVHEDALYLFGGYTGERRVNDFFRFSFNEREWTTVPVAESSEPPPSPRDRHSAVVVNGKFWVFGGYDGRERTNQLHSFDFLTRKWRLARTEEGTPSARHSHCAAALGRSFFVFGGYDGSYKNDLCEFDTVESSWLRSKPVGKPPSPRYRSTLVAYQDALYLFAGHDGFKHLNDVHVFSREQRVWSQLVTTNPPPSPRDSHCAVVNGAFMFVFGGSSGNANNDFYKLRLKDGGAWNKVNTTGMVPSPRFCHAAAVYKRTMYVFGGYDGVQRLDDFIEWSFADCRVSHVPRSTLVSDLESLVGSTRCSDVVFKVDGQLIHAHKVLCSRCPYFHAMFNTGMRESTAAEVEIPDVHFDVFRALLVYLYTDRINATLEQAMELFVCADRFGVDRLRAMCENKMLSSIDINNVSELLAASECHSAKSLHDRCLEFIVANFDTVSKTASFETMVRNNVDLIFEVLQAR